MASKKALKSKLSELGVTPRKSRGQNFLTDDTAIRDVIDFAELSGQESVVEIGPGMGAITKQLIDNSRCYLGIELEEDFAKQLSEKYAGEGVNFLNKDIREFELNEGSFVVVGNIPYSISSEVILWFLDNTGNISRASFLFQREFAERIAAKPGTREVGSLSILTQAFARAELGAIISGDKFHPRARVESRLLRLVPLQNPKVTQQERANFEKVVRASFSQRRKTLLNSLAGSQKFQFSKSELEEFIRFTDIEISSRAESLSLEQFISLSRALDKE